MTVVICFSLSTGVPAKADDGSLTVGAEVPPAPPAIHFPRHFMSVPHSAITAHFTCEADFKIAIALNSQSVGPAKCPVDGTFFLPLTLQQGSNSLIIQHLNSSGQPAADSATATVFYTPEHTAAPIVPPNNLLLAPIPGLQPPSTFGPVPVETPASQLQPAQFSTHWLWLLLLLLLCLIVTTLLIWRLKKNPKEQRKP